MVGEPTAPMASRPRGLGLASDFGVGTQIGRYVVTRKLGQGGAGEVYEAYDTELDRKIALKLLRSAGSPDSDAESGWAQVVREARIVARLNHPNVVVIHETGRHGGRPFIVMELVEGQDLSSWASARAGRSLADVVAVLSAAGRGLQAAHDAGVIHGDFKPANVLVGAQDRPRVADFGVARLQVARSSDSELASRDDAKLATSTGRFATSLRLVGTPYYMAPELGRARRRAFRSVRV